MILGLGKFRVCVRHVLEQYSVSVLGTPYLVCQGFHTLCARDSFGKKVWEHQSSKSLIIEAMVSQWILVLCADTSRLYDMGASF